MMNNQSVVSNQPADANAAPAPLTSVEELAPWEQLARQIEDTSHPASAAAPRVQLRGDRAFLRALRAAEMTAWGDTAFFPADRSIVLQRLTNGTRIHTP
jgi:hypothetical protein